MNQALESAAASARTAEETASEAVMEAVSLRHMVERAENKIDNQPITEVTTTVGKNSAGGLPTEEDSRETLVRLEARVELAEARQRISLQEVRSQIDDLARRHHSLKPQSPD